MNLLFCLILFIDPRPTVVRVDSTDYGRLHSLGTGTAVAWKNNQGLIITAQHVIRNSTGKVTIKFPNQEPIDSKIVATDKIWDLALLIFEGPQCPTVLIGAKAPIKGDLITICGYGSGSYREVTGILLAFFSPIGKEPNDIIELSVSARSGDSGGSMFFSNGTLAAVLFGSDKTGAHGSHCLRVRWFIETQLKGYDALKTEALRKKTDFILYGDK